jgi:hypothetical protein
MPSLFLPRSRPWLWATAAEGGLEPAPASRFRGALPHRLNSYALLGLSALRAHGALLPTNHTENARAALLHGWRILKPCQEIEESDDPPASTVLGLLRTSSGWPIEAARTTHYLRAKYLLQ